MSLANKMCVTETYIRVRVGKHLCDVFALKNAFKNGDLYGHSFSVLLQITPLGGFR